MYYLLYQIKITCKRICPMRCAPIKQFPFIRVHVPIRRRGRLYIELIYQSMNITVVKNGLTSVDVNMLEFLQVMDLGDSMRLSS